MKRQVYLIIANNSGGLYRFRKELITRLILDGNEVHAVTPFDESVEELKQLGLHLIEQPMNRRGTNPLQEVRLLLDYRRIINAIELDMWIWHIRPDMLIRDTLNASLINTPY